jgi:hypothetical protein
MLSPHASQASAGQSSPPQSESKSQSQREVDPYQARRVHGSTAEPAKVARQQSELLRIPHDALKPKPKLRSEYILDVFADADQISPHTVHPQQNSISGEPFVTFSATSALEPSGAESSGVDSDEMAFTGDKRPGKRLDAGNKGRLGGWWPTGGSPLGAEGSIPKPQISAQHSRNSSTDSTPTRPPRKSQTEAGNFSTPKRTSTASTSRFAFLASPMSALSRLTQSPAASGGDDELLTLNIDTALFPSSSTTDRDAFSPAAFKNLQTNATGLLNKFQNAYRERTAALREVHSERTAQSDELEEAETRATLLKLQLDEMARKAATQEQEMKKLMEDLEAEKRLRLGERIAREKGLTVTTPNPMSEGSTVSEDLGVEDDQRRKWRKSLDTDEESVEDGSIFSRSRSPTIAQSIFEGSVSEQSTPHTKAVTLGPPKPRTLQQMSTFQKILKGISGETLKEEDESQGNAGCRNCRGQDASVAWDTVSLLRDENKAMKQRVAQLETSVESALDAVNGIGL